VVLKDKGWSRLRDIRSFDCWWGDFSTQIEDYNLTSKIPALFNFLSLLVPPILYNPLKLSLVQG
jgi:hypothetical protein